MTPPAPKQSKVLIIWSVSLVVLIITYGLALFPKQRQLHRLKQKTAASRKAIESLQKLTSPLARTAMQTHQDQIASQVNRLVFNANELAHFDFKVREMASQSKISHFDSRNRFKKTTHQDATSPKALSSQQISMSAQCDFMGFLQFINALERHDPAAFITQFQLHRSYEDKIPAPAQATLNVSIFHDL